MSKGKEREGSKKRVRIHAVVAAARPLLENVRDVAHALTTGSTSGKARVRHAQAIVDVIDFVLSLPFDELLTPNDPIQLDAVLEADVPEIFRTIVALRRWAIEAPQRLNWDIPAERASIVAWAAIFGVVMYSYARRFRVEQHILTAVALASGRDADAVANSLDTLYEALIQRDDTEAALRKAADEIGEEIVPRSSKRQTPAF
jgi:hypothetical protein